MDQATHNKIVSFIWGIADDVLRDQCFPDLAIVSTLSTQLSWSHFIELRRQPHRRSAQRQLRTGSKLCGALFKRR